MAHRLHEFTMGLQQIDEVDDMKFSLNSQGNTINGKQTNGNESVKNEEIEMKNANNIQMNLGNSGALLIRNTTKLLGGLALAGMVAMAATFGSVSADSPLTSSSYMVHGPNAMDVEYLNKLSSSFMIHGPNAMDAKYLNNLGSDNIFRIYEPDVVDPSTASVFRIHGPDVAI